MTPLGPAGGADEFPASVRGAIMIGGQKIQLGLSHARKTAEVVVEADTRALRHIQRRRAFELVSAQQHHSEFLARRAPGGVARLTLGHENSYDAIMPRVPTGVAGSGVPGRDRAGVVVPRSAHPSPSVSQPSRLPSLEDVHACDAADT
jgi:hypothetical protein